jgi:hypothetical protein
MREGGVGTTPRPKTLPTAVADAATRMDLARQACAAMATRVAATASHLRRTAHLLERCGTAVKKLRIVRLGFGTW